MMKFKYKGKEYEVDEPNVEMWSKLVLLQEWTDEREFCVKLLSFTTGLTEEEIENKIMSSLRTAVENDIALLKVQTWHGICKRVSILHNHNRIVPLAACILKNAYICMNEGSSVKRFNVTPPVLEDYFG
jgi:hypothetical protein